ncbi:MAG: hypothetical protein LBQ86_06985 [Holophagales bacterium]|jgi:hypothetical protein|nr:hypothetical protein [Holophagales bacterium]
MILKLKNFHVDIKRTHGEKVIAYISYWLLHRKPIQIIDNSVSEENEELVILNEKFVLQYIVDFLSKRIQREHVLLREEKGLQNFSKLLLYYLVHRLYNAQSLEMMIIAFFAGQIYENIEKDISEELCYYS